MDKKKKEELDKKWKAIVVKAVTDPNFKDKLVTDTVTVMKENGLALPEGCNAAEGTGKRFVIQHPADASDEVKEEVKWWILRLDMTREFAKDDRRKIDNFVMNSQEESACS